MISQPILDLPVFMLNSLLRLLFAVGLLSDAAGALVGVTIVLFAEHLIAVLARVRPLVLMHLKEVLLHVCPLREGLVAALEWAAERLVFCVRAHVVHEFGRIRHQSMAFATKLALE